MFPLNRLLAEVGKGEEGKGWNSILLGFCIFNSELGLGKGLKGNGTKKSPKACLASFPVLRLGTYSEWAATSGQALGGSASHGGFLASSLGTSQDTFVRG